uniref:Uncharacterized protein n=1 Tax=Arundo donax TaxID=35708 RepID=A0A0A9H7C8_ARUDO
MKCLKRIILNERKTEKKAGKTVCIDVSALANAHCTTPIDKRNHG